MYAQAQLNTLRSKINQAVELAMPHAARAVALARRYPKTTYVSAWAAALVIAPAATAAVCAAIGGVTIGEKMFKVLDK